MAPLTFFQLAYAYHSLRNLLRVRVVALHFCFLFLSFVHQLPSHWLQSRSLWCRLSLDSVTDGEQASEQASIVVTKPKIMVKLPSMDETLTVLCNHMLQRHVLFGGKIILWREAFHVRGTIITEHASPTNSLGLTLLCKRVFEAIGRTSRSKCSKLSSDHQCLLVHISWKN